MDSTTAMGLKELNLVKMETALVYHFTGNHFPPLPLSLIPVAMKAIENGNKGLWSKAVRLPAGISFKGKKLAPTRDCIRAWHLDFFLDNDDEVE